MMFNDTFNNISVCFRGLNTMIFNDTFNNIEVLFQRVRVKMFNDTFSNISVCFRGLGLWCLMTLSTIFQFVLEG